MNKNIILSVLLALITTIAANAAYLPEGYLFSNVNGIAAQDPETGIWRFASQKPIGNEKYTAPAGTSLALLPSRGLETIIAYAEDSPQVSIRLTGVTTTHKGINYLFPMDVDPIKQISVNEPSEQPKEPTDSWISLSTDPNETQVIPKEVLEQMKNSQRTDFAKIDKTQPPGIADRVIIKENGYYFLINDFWRFKPDGFGTNISREIYTILPCEGLEQIAKTQQSNFSRARFEVSGTITNFNGHKFLLIHRTKRTYTQGNLTP